MSRARAHERTVLAVLRDVLAAFDRPAYLLDARREVLFANGPALDGAPALDPQRCRELAECIRPGAAPPGLLVRSIEDLGVSLHVVLAPLEPPHPDAPALAAAARHGLTPTETEVLVLRSRGLTRRAIAEALGSAEATVKVHLERIHQKLDVRRALALQARLFGHRAGT